MYVVKKAKLKINRLYEIVFIVSRTCILIGSYCMDVLEAIQKRRSIRSYLKKNLPQEVVNQLLEAARWAPSAGNVQPWAFVVVSSEAMKQKLSMAAFGQRDLEEASVVIVVCADQKRAEQSYGARGKTLYCIQDTAAAVENILLTATSLGLGACWIGAFKEEEIWKAIKAPKDTRPVALIPVGYPNESPPARSRRPLSEIVHKETF
jgi:nitroreductase